MKMRVYYILLLAYFAVFADGVWTDGSNGIIIQMDTETGIFGIGDTVWHDGLRGRPITFDFHSPWRRGRISHFNILIDDELYSSGYPSGGDYTLLDDEYLLDAGLLHNFLYANWEIPIEETDGSIQIQQILEPVLIDGLGQCKTQYIVYNNDTIRHRIGFLMNQDIIINDNDRAPIAAGGFYSDVGMYYSDNTVPYYWQAFEESPGAGTDQLVASGYLRGLDATAPNIFTYGNQPFLQRTYWDPDTARYLGDEYYDTGIVIRWNQQYVNPGKDVEFNTYLGLGKANPSDDSLILITLAPSELRTNCTEIRPNPFEVTILAHNQHIPSFADDVNICLENPEGIELIFAEGHWPDACHDLPEIPYGETRSTAWMCQLDSLYDFPDEPLVFYLTLSSSSISYEIRDSFTLEIPNPTGIPPTVEEVFDHKYTSFDFDSIMAIPYLVQDDEEIDLSSLRSSINGEVITYFTPWWSFSDDTLYLHDDARDYESGDTIVVNFNEIADIAGCVADGLPLSDTIIIDTEPPRITRTFPEHGNHVDTIPQVTFWIEDPVSGINYSTINIIADGELYNIDSPNIELTDSTLTFTAERVYEHREILEIEIAPIYDNIDWGEPNMSEPFSYWFWADTNAIAESNLSRPNSLKISAIYPNPGNSSVVAEISADKQKIRKISVYDITGQIVDDQFTISKPSQLNSDKLIVEISSDVQSSGLYLLSVSIDNNINLIKPFTIIK
ncbi:MAG: T9SS type A sorting domain-containing protein [Candidatus Zixiibacteriota bacterium]